MELPSFDNYSVAGMAVMYTVNYTFDITKLFPMIPISWSRLNFPSRGDLISAKYGTYQRGCPMIKSGCMKNMIMMRMSMDAGDKSVSIKFNSDKIHICGTKDYDTPRMVCESLLEHLDILYDTVDSIQKDYESYRALILEGPTDSTPQDYLDYLDSIRPAQDGLIIDFIENQVYDYLESSYDDPEMSTCVQQLLHLVQGVDLDGVPDVFEIVKESTNMLNFNYDASHILQRPVRLVKYSVLDRLMEIRNCVIHSDNRMKQNITIQLRSKDGHVHRIIINRNGKIIHSSHDLDSMRAIYESLMPILLEGDCVEDVDLYKIDRYRLEDVLQEG